MPLADLHSWLDALAVSDQFHRLGWVVIHSLWQAAAVAAALAVVLRLVPQRSTFGQDARYVLATLALFSLPVACVVTWAVVEPPRAAVAFVDGNDRSTTATIFGAAADVAPAVRGSGAPSASQAFHILAAHAATAVEPWLPVCAALWLAGVLAGAARLAVGWSLTRRLVATGVAIHDGCWQARLDRWRSALGIAWPIGLVASSRVDVPIVVGWLRPVVIWPVAAVAGMPPEQVEAIMAHELAHIRRHDVLVNLLQSAVEAVFFHHPAAWWISAQVRTEREHCADELAIRTLTAARAGSRVSYVMALLSLEERRQAILAAAVNGGSLSGRIRRLAGIEQASGHPGRLAAAVVVLAAIVAGEVAVVPGRSGAEAAATPKSVVPRGDDLEARLNSIKSLTPTRARELVAQAMSSHPQRARLCLNGLTSLDADTARALAEFRGTKLCLNGLTALDAATAEALADFRGWLALNGLTILDAATARALAESQAGILSLKGLAAVDAGAARMLVKFRGWLGLNGLTALDAATAKTLAEFTGEELSLDGLATLDPDTARELAKVKGRKLSLNGLTTLDAAAAKEVTDFKGWLILNGLTRLDADAARALGGFKGTILTLKGLTTLDASVAESLAALQGCLGLTGLTALDVNTARALASFQGRELYLTGLTTLDVDTARALAECKGQKMSFGGIGDLDADAAAAIAKFRGPDLVFGHHREFNAEAARALAARAGRRRPVIIHSAAVLRIESVPRPEQLDSLHRTSSEHAL